MKIGIVSADRSDSNGQIRNLGDAFLTDAIVAELASRGIDAEAVDFGPLRQAASSHRVPVRGLLEFWSFLRSTDAIIVGGGTLLQDDKPDVLFGGLPRLCLATSLLAWPIGKPLAFFAVGCDPVSRTIPRVALSLAVRGRVAYVRDARSKERVEQELKGRARLAADACLLPAASRLLADATSFPPLRSGTLLALSANEESALTPALLAKFRMRGSKPRLLAMAQGAGASDIGEHARRVARGWADIVEYPISWEDAALAVQSAEVVIASRMHALYLALLTNTPMIAIGSSPKIEAFVEEFGIKVFPDIGSCDIGAASRASPRALDAARGRAVVALDALLADFRRASGLEA